MINPKISRATLGRAPAYLKFLRGIEDSTANISATTIAKELELGAHSAVPESRKPDIKSAN